MPAFRIERIVELPDESSVALRRGYTFMTAHGYRYSAQPAPPSFHRGTRLTHLISLTPKSWQVTVAITVPEEGPMTAHCLFTVDTTGQIVTLLERDFWESEADELAATLRNDPIPPKSVTLGGAAAKQNLGVLGLAVLATIATIFLYPALTLRAAAGAGAVAFLIVFGAGHVWLARRARHP